MKNETRLRRLRKLRDILHQRARAPRKTFCMEIWHREDRECATAACALGWAAMNPTFMKKGLRLIMAGYANKKIPAFKRARGVPAGAKFFGISEGEAGSVFTPSNARGDTPRAVARQVQRLIERYSR